LREPKQFAVRMENSESRTLEGNKNED